MPAKGTNPDAIGRWPLAAIPTTGEAPVPAGYPIGYPLATFRLPDPVPVAPLQQINLKVPEVVAAHWRTQAAAAGLSVRDWLVSITAPTGEARPPGAGAAAAELAERVALLETAVAELREALPLLQARPPRSTRPAPAAPPAAPLPPPDDLPADGIETAALADLLGLKRGTLNAKVIRNGGPRPGLVLEGWRCLGMQPSKRGGPPRARWLPAG